MKFKLRDSLAVSQDWNLFDAYISFSFGPNESVVALVGKTKAQPYYSTKDPRHGTAAKAGIELPGGEDQYVIDFSYPTNQKFVSRISKPIHL